MIRAIFAAAALLAALFVVVATQGSDDAATPRGDANCNGIIDLGDAMASLQLASGVQDAVCAAAADTDCDGDATAVDALRILAHVSGADVSTPAGCSPIGSTPTPAPSQSPTATPAPATHLAPSPTPTPTAAATSSPSPMPTPTISPTFTSSPSPGQTPQVGGEPDCAVFPPDNPWNTDISGHPVHANSDDYVDSVGRYELLHPDVGTVWAGSPIGIPYVIVGDGQPGVPVIFYYDDESDPGPYPVPPDIPLEGQPVGQPNAAGFGGDRHAIVIDDDACVLYEMYDAHPVNGGASWEAGSGAVFDLTSNELRPDYWTSADAAGLPIFPGLVRYEEVVEQGVIDHALRFTVSQTQRAFIHPATHWASSSTDPDRPPMGLRFRMKASYDCSWASSEVQVICAALKKYGMFVADNGADWYISGAPDPRWDDDRLGDLKSVPGDAFEVVDTGEAVVTS